MAIKIDRRYNGIRTPSPRRARHLLLAGEFSMLRPFVATLLSLGICPFLAAQEGRDDLDFFEKSIRPNLIEHCYDCHASETDSREGGLRLDSRQGLLDGGDSGPAIVPGDADASLIVEAIAYSRLDLQMPPDGRLDEAVVDAFRKWINEGAADPREATNVDLDEVFDVAQRSQSHWAWQPIQSSFPPEASIDSFIDRSLSQLNLPIADQASPAELVRRLTLDLHGLPPSPVRVEQFLDAWRDDPINAYTSLVDELLADPKFGEHWAIGWLDLVRYSETKGHVTDQGRPFAWKYRDYIVEAFNDDVGFDQLVREHIAGDLLPPSLTREGGQGESNISPTATGALFMHEMHFMAVDPVKQRWDEIDAQIEVIGKAFLGLTIECARCHDHKFDAISQADYYALAGFLYSTEQGTARTAPRVEVPTEQADALQEAEEAYTRFLENKRRQRRQAQTPKVGEESYFPISEELGIQSPNDSNQLRQLMQQLQQLDPSWQHWVRSAVDTEGHDAPLLIRGDHRNPGDVVPRRFLEALSVEPFARPVEFDHGSGRRWLAEQFVATSNPLTARVWVNRLWHHLFGRGIVATPSNFGVLGQPPSHPELLDYLASRLIAEQWSTKTLIRQIVVSAAYQRTSRDAEPDALGVNAMEVDPDNVWLRRQNVRRMTAEQIRDTLLTVTGELDESIGGPSIACYIPPYATANKPSNIPISGPLDGDGRRSLYLTVRRNFYDPFLLTFDFPDRGQSIGRRTITNVPSQALAMMNSPFVHQLAQAWAERIELAPLSPTERLAKMWQSALSREPTTAELDAMLRLHDQLQTQGDAEVDCWKELAHVLLNHPDLILIH